MDEHDILTRYLDALADGFDPDPSDLDPELVATVHHLRDLGNRAHPDSSFVDTLEETLMNASPLARSPIAGAPATLRPPSRSNPGSVAVMPPARAVARHWATAALAAVLLILLGGAWLTQRLDGPGSDGQRPGGAVIQAPGTPANAADTASTLVDLVLPADLMPPAGKGSVYLTLDVMPAETTAKWVAEPEGCCAGIKVYYIVAGTVRVTSDGPAHLISRGGNGTMREIAPGEETALMPGDAIVLRNEYGNSWSTEADQAHILSGAVFAGVSSNMIHPFAWTYGPWVWKEGSVNLPGGPYRLLIESREIAPDEQIPLPEMGVIQFGLSETGGIGQSSDGTLSVPVALEPVEIYRLVIETVPDAACPSAG
ncbi:MAG: hypothetical protein M3Y37_08075 [Chloroflexota bacterium]|nr:hypothetical protein [Chloroflexota bacterium]